jgi:hypothetical protein
MSRDGKIARDTVEVARQEDLKTIMAENQDAPQNPAA